MSKFRSNLYFMTILKTGRCEPMNKDSKVPMSPTAYLNISEMFMSCNASANRVLIPNKIVDQVTVSYNQFRFKQIRNN